MKALIALMKYDYGVRERGYSYEYYNIFLPISDLLGQTNIIHFDFYDEYLKNGKAKMNQNLKELIDSEKPDFTLVCLFENEFDEAVINSLRDVTKTVAYFIDDPWRQEFANHWRKYFDYSTTPDYYMNLQYQSENVPNVIYCPFGFNPSIYKKIDLQKKYDVSFVGGFSAYRKWIIKLLRKQGINVEVFGRDWDSKNKWISQEQMVEIFNSSKINLNLSNAITKNLSLWLSSAFSLKALKELLLLRKHREQVKGRHYEINGCGGFQLSYFVPSLNEVYEINKEIAVFNSPYELSDKIKQYLQNEELRNQIANEGYDRSQRDHTAQGYLKNLLDTILNN